MIEAHPQGHMHGLVQIGHTEFAQRLQPRIGLPVWLDHIGKVDDFFKPGHIGVPGRMPADGAEHLRVMHIINVLREVHTGHSVHKRFGFLHHRIELFILRRFHHLAERQAFGAVVQKPGQRGLLFILAELPGHLARGLFHAERMRIARRIQLFFEPVFHFFAFHRFNSMPVFAP